MNLVKGHRLLLGYVYFFALTPCLSLCCVLMNWRQVHKLLFTSTLNCLILPHSMNPIGWLNWEPFSIENQTNQCWAGPLETIRRVPPSLYVNALKRWETSPFESQTPHSLASRTIRPGCVELLFSVCGQKFATKLNSWPFCVSFTDWLSRQTTKCRTSREDFLW